MSITGQWIFIQMNIFINDIKEIEHKQKVLVIKYYKECSSFRVLYLMCILYISVFSKSP